MPSQKQNPLCLSSKRRRRSDSKKAFKKDWKKSLAESDRGSYYTQAENWGETNKETRDTEGASKQTSYRRIYGFLLSNNLSQVEVFRQHICKDHARRKFKHVTHASHFFKHKFL